MFDQYRRVTHGSDYCPPEGGKKYRLILFDRSNHAFIVDDFDDLQDAIDHAQSIYDPAYPMRINDSRKCVVGDAGAPNNPNKRRDTYSSAQPISVTRLCGLEAKKTAYRRRRW